MHKIKIKPLSVNCAWKGKRYKTDEYKYYEQELIYTLPKILVKPIPLIVTLHAGINKQADIDNIAKPFIDILQKKYGFNDNQIYELHLIKFAVNKGNEFISFKIEYYE